MTSGRWLVIAILLFTLLFGGGLWYAQTRAFYVELDAVTLSASRPDGSAIALPLAQARGIDAGSSPLRFRACAMLAEGADLSDAMEYETPTPLVAPDWFDCFDAAAIAAALEDGSARALLGTRNIARGVDRVLAVTQEGRVFAWHQLNGTLE